MTDITDSRHQAVRNAAEKETGMSVAMLAPRTNCTTEALYQSKCAPVLLLPEDTPLIV